MTMSSTAQTILSQLGGNRFLAMTGAKHLIYTDRSLSFRLPSKFARDGINLVTVRLDPSDTYTVQFRKVRGLNVRDLDEVSDVYVENLRDVFTERTGLYCTL